MKETRVKNLLLASAAASVLFLSSNSYAADNDAQEYAQQAEEALKKGDGRAALIQYRNAVKADPDDAQLRLKLGRLLVLAGDGVGAERELRAARDRKVDDVEVLPLLTRAYLIQNQPEKVLREIDPATGTPERRSVALTAIGEAQLSMKHLDEAEHSLTEAEQLNPKARATKAGAGSHLAGARQAGRCGRQVRRSPGDGSHQRKLASDRRSPVAAEQACRRTKCVRPGDRARQAQCRGPDRTRAADPGGRRPGCRCKGQGRSRRRRCRGAGDAGRALPDRLPSGAQRRLGRSRQRAAKSRTRDQRSAGAACICRRRSKMRWASRSRRRPRSPNTSRASRTTCRHRNSMPSRR